MSNYMNTMTDDSKVILDLRTTCRTCLLQKSNLELQSLLENNLQKALCEIANIQLNFHSSLPTSICTECLKVLNLTIKFRHQIHETESQLQKLVISVGQSERTNPMTVIYKSYTILDNSNLSKKNVYESKESPVIIESTGEAQSQCTTVTNKIYERNISGNVTKDDTDCNLVRSGNIEDRDINYFISDDNNINISKHQQMDNLNLNRNSIYINGNISNVIKWADSENNSISTINNFDEISEPSTDNQRDNIFSQQTLKDIPKSIDDVKTENDLNEVTGNDKNIEKIRKTSNFNCNLCSKKFRYEFGYMTHLLKHGELIVCKLCGTNFNEPKMYLNHLKADHPGFKPFTCPSCDKTFAVMSTLKKHFMYHINSGSTRKYACGVCGRKFSQQNFLATHKKIHTGNYPYQCEVCNKTFASGHGLRNHLKIHRGEKKHKCDICEARFIHRFSLRAHQRTHSGEKPFACKMCNNSFSTSSYLKIHMRTHTAEKPYTCLWCQKNFVSRCALAAHEKSHTGEKKFQCDICGWRSTRLADLQTHIRSHTGEKPYFCDQCEKRYKTASNLAAHKKTHLGLREHVCHICNKAFGDPRTLKCHIRVHTGETPYQCHICGNRFKQSGQLSAHRKTHKN